MDPVHVHVALAHVPVVAFPLALAGWLLAWRRADGFWERAFALLWLACCVGAAAVYFSGGSAFEVLRLGAETQGGAWPLLDRAETHAVAGRAALLTLLLSGAAQLQILLAAWQGQPAGPAPRWVALGLGVAAVALLLITAGLGGDVGHPEFG
jgi:hypothetical protein